MKIVLIVLAILGMVAMFNAGTEAYAQYKHERIILECKKKIDGPRWTERFTDWGCEQWAD